MILAICLRFWPCWEASYKWRKQPCIFSSWSNQWVKDLPAASMLQQSKLLSEPNKRPLYTVALYTPISRLAVGRQKKLSRHCFLSVFSMVYSRLTMSETWAKAIRERWEIRESQCGATIVVYIGSIRKLFLYTSYTHFHVCCDWKLAHVIGVIV